jgi:hypothetical protein
MFRAHTPKIVFQHYRHQTDLAISPTNVRYRGQNGLNTEIGSGQLMTDAVEKLFKRDRACYIWHSSETRVPSCCAVTVLPER